MRLDEVLQLTRPLVGVDLETTGVDVRTAGIVELALEIMVPGQPVVEYRTLINPLLRIPEEASAIHGIRAADVADAPTFRKLAANLLAGLTGCDFAGYNVLSFDLPMLREEFTRAGLDWSYEDAAVIDGFRLWQVAEGRTLTDAVNRWCGEAQLNPGSPAWDLGNGKAHNALWDVKAATRVAAAQLLACEHLPRDPRALHDLCWPDRFDADGKLRWKDGVLCFNFGEHRNKPVASVPAGYRAWVQKKDFSDKVKAAMKDPNGFTRTPRQV